MTSWVRLTLPAAVVASVSPAYAVQYLTIDAAQKLAFPSANRFVENGGLTWKAQAADRLLGLFVVDHVVGKSAASPLKVGSDIRNISGATLSSLHVAEGVKRILATYGSRTR